MGGTHTEEQRHQLCWYVWLCGGVVVEAKLSSWKEGETQGKVGCLEDKGTT